MSELPPGATPDVKRLRVGSSLSSLLRGEGVSQRVTHAGLLLSVSVLVALIILPGLHGQQIPELGREDLGKPFRRSPAGFKAGRDYEVVDRPATEHRRAEASAAVRPVFDYDASVQADVSLALARAFAELQDFAAGLEQEEPVVRKREGGKEKAEHALMRWRSEARKAFEDRLRGIEEEDFDALVAAHFSQDVQRATTALVESAFRSKLVGSRDELSRVDARGIVIRELGLGSEQRLPSGSAAVRDLTEAHAELDRFAAAGTVLPEGPLALRRAIVRLAKRHLRPNLTINLAETDARRRAAEIGVKAAVIAIKKGQQLIADGELVNESHVMIAGAMRAQTDQVDFVQLYLGATGLVTLLIGGCYVFHRSAFRRFRPTRKDALLLGLLLITLLGVLHVWVMVAEAVHDRYSHVPLEALYVLMPLAAGAALVRFLLTQELALFFAVVLSFLAAILVGNSLTFGLYALVGSLVAADRIALAKDRAGIFKAGLATGAVNLFTMLFFALAEGKGLSADSLWTCGFALIGTVFGLPMLVMALTPLSELALGYASDIKLLELANLNHPALKELIVQAPGTYHHSIIIGSLVEAAAESIDANPLLARSCAYYHDLGKGKNPLYFGENQKGENRHDSIAPAMSALIIKRHVTDGAELARLYKLPKRLADAICQHHGTRRVAFFHHKALQEQQGKEHPQPLDDALYRYPGPKPQFREAALLMIADAVEAASRSLPEPTHAKLESLVNELINTIFSEGQLDDCELTLRDLSLIAAAFVRTLESIYHARPAYPPGAAVFEPPRPALAVASALAPSRSAGS